MFLRRRDLPLGRDPSGRFLPWLIAVMVYLAALALVGAMAMSKIATRWDSGLTESLTVQIPPPEAGAPARRAEEDIDRVIEQLLAAAGVTRAEVLEPDEIAALLEPWLGAEAAYRDLPMPSLIAVTIDSEVDLDLERLAAAIAEAVPGALLDDHKGWLGGLIDLARAVEMIAVLIVLLVGAAAISMMIFTTRMGLSIHAQVIELLHLIGAQDSYIAREFQVHALALALRGGLLGLGLALATLLLLGNLVNAQDSALWPDFTLSATEWAALAFLPVGLAVIAMVTARLTVLRTLGRLP